MKVVVLGTRWIGQSPLRAMLVVMCTYALVNLECALSGFRPSLAC